MSMNREVLLDIAKKIMDRGSAQKSELSLRELRRILLEQHAPAKDIELIDSMIRYIPEVKEQAETGRFDEYTVSLAVRRGEARRKREMEAMQYGRC